MIFQKIIPVIVMIMIGVICRRKQIISSEGINGLKILTTSFMLPVLLFHTLAVTEYTWGTLLIVGIMLFQLCLAFGIGFVVRKCFPSIGTLFPYFAASFEGGLLGYPLYGVLCGIEHLADIAMLDIANTMFVFTIFIALLMAEMEGNFMVDRMIRNVLHSPVFWGVFLGIVVGISGIIKENLNTAIGQIYLAVKDMMTSALSACILVVVGYGMSMKKSVLVDCGKSVGIRFVIQAMLLVVVLFLLREVYNTVPMRSAIVLYAMLPPTFVIPAYVKTEKDSTFISTATSMYAIITILVFAVMTFVNK